MLALVLFGFSCTKPNSGNRADTPSEEQKPDDGKDDDGKDDGGDTTPDEPAKPEVKTCAENLVVHISFDEDALVDKGEGVSFGENKGAVEFKTGFIGKAWTNKGGDNTAEAYTKINLAAGNAFTKLESFTFTAWAKLPKDKEAKSGIISFNGTGVENTWPSFIFLFDNISDVDLEDGTKMKAQQFNGRIDFLTVEGKPALWPNCASDIFLLKDTWFQMARTYDATTGHWANYANGMIINEGDFLPNDAVAGPVNSAFAADCNALYVGGWASRIEKKASDAWQAYCPGSLDEIRFYNKALSGDEINALYKEELNINLDQEE